MPKQSNGWIKLYRQMIDWCWYKDVVTKAVFLHLLLKANSSDKDIFVEGGIKLQRGQVATSYQRLSDELGISYRQARTAISHLIATEEVTVSRRATISIISIKNYNQFQKNDRRSDNHNVNHGVNPSYINKKHSKECQRNTLLECKEEEGRQKSDKTDSASSSEEIPNWTPEGRYMPIIRWVEDSDE